MTFRPLDWMDDASCVGMPLDVFFIERTEGEGGYKPGNGRGGYQAARAVCAKCPVIDQCRKWNDSCERHMGTDRNYTGFFAGETPQERAKRRRATGVRRPRAVEPPKNVVRLATRRYGSLRAAAFAYADYHKLNRSSGIKLFERLKYGQSRVNPDTRERLEEFLYVS